MGASQFYGSCRLGTLFVAPSLLSILFFSLIYGVFCRRISSRNREAFLCTSCLCTRIVLVLVLFCMQSRLTISSGMHQPKRLKVDRIFVDE
jgi:hypothetical protein